MKAHLINKNSLIYLLFIVFLTICFHLIFSSNGYFIGDQGLTLANAQRMLNGEIPHRDFISIRPVFFLYFWSLIIKIFGSYTFWASRFLLWAQFSLITYLWLDIFEIYFQRKLDLVTKCSFFLIGLLLTSNFVILEAWYNTDALMFASIGIWFLKKEENVYIVLGMILAGVSIVIKQSYLGILPAVLLFSKNTKKAVWATPLFFTTLLVYLIYLKHFNAYEDYRIQMAAFSEPFKALWNGFLSFAEHKASWRGIILGVSYCFVLPLIKNVRTKNIIKYALISFVWVYGALFFVQGHYPVKYPYFLFGIIFIFATEALFRKRLDDLKLQLALLGFAFITAASLGKWYPFNVNGIMGIYLLFKFSEVIEMAKLKSVVIAIALITLPTWWYARLHFVFGDRPTSELTSDLSSVLPAGQKIFSNAETFKALKSIQSFKSKYVTKQFAVVPDFGAYWVDNEIKNPIPSDWAFGAEIEYQPLMDRVVDSIKNTENGFVVLLHKNDFMTYAQGFKNPYKQTGYSSSYLEAIKREFQLIDQDDLFEVWIKRSQN